MGNAALTDSSVPISPSLAALLPTAGSSTKTTSVTSFWACSEMPTVPSGEIHSCDLANRSFWMSCMASSFLFFTSRIKRELGDFRGHGPGVALDGEGAGQPGWDVSHRDTHFKRGGKRSAGHEARNFPAAENSETVSG